MTLLQNQVSWAGRRRSILVLRQVFPWLDVGRDSILYGLSLCCWTLFFIVPVLITWGSSVLLTSWSFQASFFLFLFSSSVVIQERLACFTYLLTQSSVMHLLTWSGLLPLTVRPVLHLPAPPRLPHLLFSGKLASCLSHSRSPHQLRVPACSRSGSSASSVFFSLPGCSFRSLSSALLSQPVSPSRRMRTLPHSVRWSSSSYLDSPGHSVAWYSLSCHGMSLFSSYADSCWSSLVQSPADRDCSCFPSVAACLVTTPCRTEWTGLNLLVILLFHQGGFDLSQGVQGWTVVLLRGWGVPSLCCILLLPGLGRCDLQFQVVIGFPSVHHLSGRMILLKIGRKITPLLILLRLCPGPVNYVAFLLLLLRQKDEFLSCRLGLGWPTLLFTLPPMEDASSDILGDIPYISAYKTTLKIQNSPPKIGGRLILLL